MKTEIIRGKNLPKEYANLMNKYREKEFGKAAIKNFKKQELDAIFFFIKDNGKLVAFGMLKPVTINYLGKTYKILGFGSGIAIEKLKGYGKALMKARINYLKERGKTGIGFTSRKKFKFFEKTGLKTKKDFIKRFGYRNPKTKEIVKDNEGDGIYYEGKDNLIKKMLKTKSIAYCNVPHW
jgi:predicted N-acetyltransferase YhbS